MAALARDGYEIDVVCAGVFVPSISVDDSLTDFVDRHFSTVMRLVPEAKPLKGWRKLEHIFGHWLLPRVDALLKRAVSHYPGEWASKGYASLTALRHPDPMSALGPAMLEVIEGLDVARYDAILSWSPYHSINRVMMKVKSRYPSIPWIAQFSDPWAGNPLEPRWAVSLAARIAEIRAVSKMDYVVHNSPASMELMKRHVPKSHMPKHKVVAHPFESDLYPQRPKAKGEKLIMRHVGVLFGRRSPEPLFMAIAQLLGQRPDLRDTIQLELIGPIEPEMLETAAARALGDIVVCRPSVSYSESLSLMYDADVLLLIEADVSNNLFLPSKLSDYIGAGSPIVGIVPDGAAHDVVCQLGGWVASPHEPKSIVSAMTAAINEALSGRAPDAWSNVDIKTQFSSGHIAREYATILSEISKR